MSCFHGLAEPTRTKTPSTQRRPLRPLSCSDSPVFVSDSDDEDNIVIKSTWRTRHSRPHPKANANTARLHDKAGSSPAMPPPSPLTLPALKTPTSLATPKRTIFTPVTVDDSSSSEDEFASLLERLKKKNNFTPRNTYGKRLIWIFQQQNFNIKSNFWFYDVRPPVCFYLPLWCYL